jgi:hypothetical protein
MVRGALLENNFAVALRAVRPRQKRSREKDVSVRATTSSGPALPVLKWRDD